MSNPIHDTMKTMEEMLNLQRIIEKEVNMETEEIQGFVVKCEDVLKDDDEEENLMLKYETFYCELKENLLKKSEGIDCVEDNTNKLSLFVGVGNIKLILKKKKENLNQIIDCINKIVKE